MIKINFKFWNTDYSEEDLEKEVHFEPIVGDAILHNRRWYKVIERGIDLDTGKYTKIHCKEKAR